MGQPVATLRIQLNVTSARRAVKRTLTEAQEANRQLAQLEESVEETRRTLESMGIRLEVTET